MNPVRFSLRYPQVTFVLTVMLVLLGFDALLRMPRREDPKVPWMAAIVSAAYPGATAEQVEQHVTRRIEEHLFRFPEVRRSRTISTSRPGALFVQVELENWVTNPDQFWSKLRHELNELRLRELPQGVLGPLVDTEFGDVTAILLAVQGERYGYRELEEYLGRIEDELRTMAAIAKLVRIGEQKEQIYVTSTMERLSQYGITPLEVIAGLQQQNVLAESGALVTGHARVPLRTAGLYQAEDQIRRQIVGISSVTGQPIYLGDFARVERRYREPDALVRVNGAPALLLSLEMHEGENIVEFGREVERLLARLRAELPPDLTITAVADQPRMVERRVGGFLRDFGLAILGVITVTMLLLPFRVAAIAATSIPATMAATFAVMQVVGIELHQVSLAGLIVVLGLVVDDSIVISDNYVDLLDQGVAPDVAAERSALSLARPVVVATLTILASFLPLAIFIPGGTGNFIRTLPLTVVVALSCSTILAMVLTPLLCRRFIRKGVRRPAATGSDKPRRGALEVMQATYDHAITMCMQRKRATMLGAVLVVLGGVGLFALVDEQFFPSAERDQFVVRVWMPAGTSLNGTDRAMRQIEAALDAEPEVVSHAAFVGRGAPRFYYAFDPPHPAPNLGQFVVNTTSVRATRDLVARLNALMPGLVPEAEVRVHELQQGIPVESPIEVRITGPDIDQLKAIGARVGEILESAPGSRFVHSNYREDSYDVQVSVHPEVANRLGMSTTVIAETLAGTLLGAPVSTFWEGSHALDIVLRLDEARRESFDHIRDLYLVSSVTGARVPLREIANLEPAWQSSRIVRRNGVRTLTVGSFTREGLLPAGLVAQVKPTIDTLSLPAGYRLEWGGEREAQQETFGYMTFALLIGLMGIFLILLFHFRRVLDVLVVMVAIPLTLFGALLGLILFDQPFGFTAFLGIISLSGVVVRNAIILLDYVHERRAVGVPVPQAALEAGQRRLRPIFLTSASAAVGVTPMIISGSTLWAPLGSVIAVGILFSMVFVLLVVPVLYALVNRRPAPAVP